MLLTPSALADAVALAHPGPSTGEQQKQSVPLLFPRRRAVVVQAAKDLHFNKNMEALKRMQAGVDKLATVVGVTIGPKVRFSVITTATDAGAPSSGGDRLQQLGVLGTRSAGVRHGGAAGPSVRNYSGASRRLPPVSIV